MLNFDVLILGSGLAGQSLALRLAAQRRVALVTKKMLEDSASGWAQGGIAAVLDAADSNEAHIQDTLTAGAGLCDVEVTRFVVEHGRSAIEWLINQGVHFTRDVSTPLGYHLTREGGHSHRRVFHVADATGAAVQETLTDKIRRHPNIAVFERHIAVDLITGAKLGRSQLGCVGAYVLDIEGDRVLTFSASHTVLATGGAKRDEVTDGNDHAIADPVQAKQQISPAIAEMMKNLTRFSRPKG